MKRFYVTTPIYYVNDKPHVGHAYSTIAADVLRRYHALRGFQTFFLTGTDEHGQKIERRAEQEKLSPQEFVDRMAPPFREMADLVGCEYDYFVRTTDRDHTEVVQTLWNKLVESGDIYLGEYEGWYSVSSEAFLSEKDLLPGNLDPITKKPVERVREKSYFFKLSKYTEPLLKFYEEHPDFVQPESRRNEVIAFVKQGLQDLSISRSSFRWGVPVPKDPEHVMYVWLDALTNYISALGGFENSKRFDEFWPPNARAVHIVGKDILRFHAIYWPAFLMSAGLGVPSQVWAHGWLTVDGEKMSKSLGNFVPPAPLVETFGRDVIRYYLMRDVAFGQDGDFSHANLLARYHGELGNGLGNLLQRTIGSILQKKYGGVIPDPGPEQDVDLKLVETAKEAADKSRQWFDQIAPHRALEAAWTLVNAANKYVDETAPWKLAKEDNRERLSRVLYTVAESLRWLSVMLWPVLPEKCDELRAQLGLSPLKPTHDLDLWPAAWGALSVGTKAKTGPTLFPRFEKDKEQSILKRFKRSDKDGTSAKTEEPKDPSQKAASKKTDGKAEESNVIDFDDFLKVDLRLGQVKEAEPVPKSDKLLRLQVDLGQETRQILAGIGKSYSPEELIGRKLVVVTNLAPRKMMGFESQGMVLAVSDESGLSILGVDKEITPGNRVS